MKNEDRLIEVMTELLAEVHDMKLEIVEIKKQQLKISEDSNTGFSRIEKELVKINLQLGSNTRAVMQMADNIKLIPAIVERITKLELAVFKKAS